MMWRKVETLVETMWMLWKKTLVQTRQTAAGWKCRNLEGAVPGFGKL